MDWQAAELLEAVERSLQSQEVEFGVNMMVCDMVLANPDLTILVLPRLRVALSTSASTTSSSSSSSSSTAAGAASQRRTQKGPPEYCVLLGFCVDVEVERCCGFFFF